MTAFLKYFDFEWKQNWVRGAFDGGKMRNDYTAADVYRVQTIQAIMGIDVTGFYDAKTNYAASQLQIMYNIQNSKSGVFGTNTLLAAEALWSKDWKFEEFYMGIFDQQVGHFIVDTTLDLAFNAAIFSGGKALLSKMIPANSFGNVGQTFTTLDEVIRYGQNLGKDGQLFVTTKDALKGLDLTNPTDLSRAERILGLPSGKLVNSKTNVLIEIDLTNKSVRFPTIGNEFFVPGGYTIGGAPERVINSLNIFNDPSVNVIFFLKQTGGK